jgi:peptidyl-prolyl cis-trans isomerase A (cyclophilin A)
MGHLKELSVRKGRTARSHRGRTLMTVMLLVITPGFASAACAQSAGQEPDLASGIRLIEEGDLDGAVTTLDALIRRWSADPARAADLAQAHLHLGAAYVLLENDKAARANFREALKRDPGIRPDPQKSPPRVLKTFETVRQEVTPTSEPPVVPPAGAASPAPAAAGPVVVMDTTLGAIRIGLDRGTAPVSTENFLSYVRSGHYDGTIFHRVIPGFMAQAGGFDAQMRQKAVRAPIKNESGNGASNRRGTLAMARTSDPDSATAQFFINVADNVRLDASGGAPGYAVFGRVLEGMEVVDRIVAVPTQSRGTHQNVPTRPVVIKTARVEGEAAKTSKPARKATPKPAATPPAP